MEAQIQHLTRVMQEMAQRTEDQALRLAGAESRADQAAQEAAIEQAIRTAGIRAEDVSFVEMVGNGNLLSDYTEMSAVVSRHGSAHSIDAPLLIGAFNGNIGHASYAVGLISLIKSVLQIQRHSVAPIINHREPIDVISQSGEMSVHIPTRLQSFKPHGPSTIGCIHGHAADRGPNVHFVICGGPSPSDRDVTTDLEGIDSSSCTAQSQITKLQSTVECTSSDVEEIEKTIQEIVKRVSGHDVHSEQSFVEAGASSVQLLKIVNATKDTHQLQFRFSIVDMFNHPTPRRLACFLYFCRTFYWTRNGLYHNKNK